MKNRNTIQKQIIMDSIKNTKTHPTAYELYEIVKEKNPNIGQATVYRTLKSMVNDKSIIVIALENGINRYDGDISPHSHLICSVCGKTTDIFNYDTNNINEIEKKYGCKISTKNIIYNGMCKNCLKKEKNN